MHLRLHHKAFDDFTTESWFNAKKAKICQALISHGTSQIRLYPLVSCFLVACRNVQSFDRYSIANFNMPERLRVFTTRRYINPLYIYLHSLPRASLAARVLHEEPCETRSRIVDVTMSLHSAHWVGLTICEKLYKQLQYRCSNTVVTTAPVLPAYLCHNRKREEKWRPLRPIISEITAAIWSRNFTSNLTELNWTFNDTLAAI